MARLLFKKFKGDRVRVLLVRELREMLRALREILLQVKQGLLNVIIVRVKGIWQRSALSLRGQGILHDHGVVDVQATQTTIPLNAAFQTDDLDAYDSNCDDISLAKVVLMANLSSYDSDILSEVPHHDTYQNDDIFNQKHDVISMVDEEETSILEEESRSKMLAKQNDPISKEKKIKQAFWLPLSNPKSEQLDVTQTPVEIEVPKEIPKVSLVKTSFQKIKNHLAGFDKVVKVRTTPDAITEGSWGFEHTKKVFKEEIILFINSLRASFKDFENGLHNKLNEVKTVLNQMEAVVEKCFEDKKYFDIKKKELSLDNDRLLDHIICQDVMNIVRHADSVLVNVLSANNKCLVNDNLEIERLEQENDHFFELLLSQDIVHICVNFLASRNDCHEMQ
ncbi:hypothetical protein Tco_0458822 [Tanacetum coccineum]